jgi:putative salt-induced outer membrane protein YdiY
MRTLLTFCTLITLTLNADQLILKNGDRITGSIIKKDAKTITIKSDAFGVITASWDQVDSITADKPLTVILKDGKSVQATLVTSGGKVEVVTPGGRIAVEPMQVETIRNADEEKAYQRLLRPGWRQLWEATGSLGLAGTAGNAKTRTFTTGFAGSRTTRNDKTSLTFSSITASALANGTTSETARAVRGSIGYDHNVSPRLFVSGFNSDEFDRFQNLDLRFVLGGGLGVHVVKGDRSRLDFTGGADYNHESFSTGLHRASGELYWGDDYSYALSKKASLVQAFRMFNNLSDTGEYRMNFDLGISTKLTRWLNWNAAAIDRYLSNPSPGRKKNDFLYTTGVGVTISR